MTVLLRIIHPDLSITRCNEACYNAETPDCKCICGGRNHGVKLDQAIRNTLHAIAHPESNIFPEPPTDAVLTFNRQLIIDHYRRNDFVADLPDPHCDPAA